MSFMRAFEAGVARAKGYTEDQCPRCGAELHVGDFPFCPHGPTRSFAVIGDDVPGGFVVENGFDRPTRFDSHSAHEAALAANGCEIRAKWAGPNDTIMTRWDTVTAQTLANAKDLVTRPSQRHTGAA